MPDCPHEHEPDTGLQTFRAIIREETDGGHSDSPDRADALVHLILNHNPIMIS